MQITDTHVPADARDQTVLEMLCAVETVPSTYLGAPGPGYRIFDFVGDEYQTRAQTFSLFTMTDEQRQLLIEASRRRASEHAAPVRGHQDAARSVVLDWQANTAHRG